MFGYEEELQDWHKLDDIAQGIGERQLMFTTKDYETIATELALHLSGLK